MKKRRPNAELGYVPTERLAVIMKKLLSIIAACALAVLLCGCAQQGSVSSKASSSASASSASASASSSAASSSATSSASAPSPSATKTYTIASITGEPNWDNIAQLDIDDAEWGDSFGICSHAKLCHDDQAIYVHMWVEEQDVRATYTPDDPLANCYEDSCLEFFLSPVVGDARYLNFEFNPNLAVCNQIGVQKTDRIRLIPEAVTQNGSSARTEDGWEITFEVPFDYIRTLYPEFSPEPGMQMRGNFYKCGNLTTNKHYLVWNHVDSDTPNFHVPESFGILMLE